MGSFHWDLLGIHDGSPLKTVEYLCHGLPILVNYHDHAQNIDTLAPYVFNLQKNPKALDEILTHALDRRQIQQLADSIRQYGFNDPVAVDHNNEIIEGVGRVLAARKLGLETIPVIVLKHLTAAQKRAYRIAHNKICLNSDFDLELLKVEFEELIKLDEPLFTGFEQAELDDLLKMGPLPDLGDDLSDQTGKTSCITCPHCGETFDVPA